MRQKLQLVEAVLNVYHLAKSQLGMMESTILAMRTLAFTRRARYARLTSKWR